jgi:hypothetical protein
MKILLTFFPSFTHSHSLSLSLSIQDILTLFSFLNPLSDLRIALFFCGLIISYYVAIRYFLTSSDFVSELTVNEIMIILFSIFIFFW